MEAYVELGARPTFTCAPYQLAGSRPGFGEHVAWAESNAIVFANSVLGARTNRYGDFCRHLRAPSPAGAPAAGLHLTEHRRAPRGHRRLGALRRRARQRRPLPGARPRARPRGGRPRRGHRRPAARAARGPPEGDRRRGRLDGRRRDVPRGRHTPEAATLDDALQGEPPDAVIEVTARDLRAARDLVQTARPRRRARRRLRRHAARLGGRAARASSRRSTARRVRTPVWVNTARDLLAEAGVEDGAARRRRDVRRRHLHLHGAGGREVRGRVMTSSAKWAYYAPANLGVEVVFGSLEECSARPCGPDREGR